MGFATPCFKRRKFKHSTGGITYTPVQLAKTYSYPIGLTGVGRTIALIELGGGFVQSDYDTYMKGLGLPTSTIEFISVDGGTNTPDGPDGADGEVMLDICVAGAMAPGSRLAVYFAPNTEQGFVDAVAKAAADGCDAISISWGAPEDASTDAAAMNSTIEAAVNGGAVVTVASGDNGSTDGERGPHVDFPASSPWALSCGGTTLTTQGANVSEVVWNDGQSGGATGGGVSTLFKIPSYQPAEWIPGGKMRGVPDVAGDADPATGIVIMVDGNIVVEGGTSGVAPMWASLSVLLAQGLNKRLGLLHPLLYKAPAGCFRDITQGNNGTYMAKAGWDACTGLGTPNGTAILNYLKGGLVPPPPPPPVTPPTGTTVYGSIVTAKDIPAGSTIHLTN